MTASYSFRLGWSVAPRGYAALTRVTNCQLRQRAFSLTKREAGLLRLVQAGVIVTDYATTMVEILKDNASPLANDLYTALDMPFATLVGQIFAANTKQASAA